MDLPDTGLSKDKGDAYEAPVADGPRADLHVHSTASDGGVAPAEVIAAAKAAGVAAVALTDHDTVAGLAEAQRAAHECALDFAAGIELSCDDDERGSTHLLGYFIDPDDPALSRHLARIGEGRRERAVEMVARLNALGIGVSFEQVLAHVSESGLIARPHLARALLEGGWVTSFREAFDRYIAAGRPAYVPTPCHSPAAGIATIQAARGLAVLAHPGEACDRDWVEELALAGLDGLEVCHPEHGRSAVRKLRRMAAELELMETGGSDWHGVNGGRGRGLGSQPVPHEWFLRLRESAAARSARVGREAAGSGG